MLDPIAPVAARCWISTMLSSSVWVQISRIADRNPRSPIRVTTNALVAARRAESRKNQKPMSR